MSSANLSLFQQFHRGHHYLWAAVLPPQSQLSGKVLLPLQTWRSLPFASSPGEFSKGREKTILFLLHQRALSSLQMTFFMLLLATFDTNYNLKGLTSIISTQTYRKALKKVGREITGMGGQEMDKNWKEKKIKKRTVKFKGCISREHGSQNWSTIPENRKPCGSAETEN